MLGGLITKVVGSRNQRAVKRLFKTVSRVNELEDTVAALQDEEFPRRTDDLKQRHRDGTPLDELLPEAFALVREAGKRALDMRHFDVQLVGGLALHQGNIAEMRTGEGKTLVATLPAYLNALTGKGVHIITVNDYLAGRDAEWMGAIYSFLGLTTGVIVSGLDQEQRKQAYNADITYGTNNEFGFDYLRDNMKFQADDKVQRELSYGIVDEVDSILIDEARTPLIISGAVDDRSDLYVSINALVPSLELQAAEEQDAQEEIQPGDYTIDEKTKQAHLTERGHDKLEKLLLEKKIMTEGGSLYDPVNIPILHHLNAALRAHGLYHRDVDYIVQDNEVVIVDEFTGRTMPGRRWSDGLHQAIEAKESVPIQKENQTLATITYQNYFRLYGKLSGMTGTADTEAYEFQQIYGLDVIVIPTHKPMIRDDQADMIFLSAKEKYNAIIDDIRDCQQHGQPVLVGTVSIEVSEYLSDLLRKNKVKHQVLNAKYHEKEAEIIAQAGRTGTVTIATNMAGRGTDIVLGGSLDAGLKQSDGVQTQQDWQQRHDEVIEKGGLRIIGSERHESRRIDNQLRGRSGRQGDPGSSRFYISLEDSLMRIFASERVAAIMQRLGMEEGEAIESRMVTRAIENAQRKVEAHNFNTRKNLLEYDDVANDQRKVIYEWRDDLLNTEDVSEDIIVMRQDIVAAVFSNHVPPGSMDELWDINSLMQALHNELGINLPIDEWLRQDEALHEDTLLERIMQEVQEHSQAKYSGLPDTLVKKLERDLMLDSLDRHWKDNLVSMDHLRQGIGLRGYAAKNPKQEYKREAYDLFTVMLDNIKQDVVGLLARIQVKEDQDIDVLENRSLPSDMQFNHPAVDNPVAAGPQQQQPAKKEVRPFVRTDRKIGRNEPCPCGSGKKYKQCHGRLNK
ncbi:MAG: preprotein translocase subunit SecA [Gammaproteobacteria bacterium]